MTVTQVGGVEVLTAGGRGDRVRYVHHRPARPGVSVPWPAWVDPAVRAAYEAAGLRGPWAHQARTAEHAYAGEHVVVSTGTASGKSLGYQLPVLTDVLVGTLAPNGRGATALYLAPTKALAQDQRRALDELGLDGVRVAVYDGDTPADEREWVRTHAAVVLSNPDLLHHSLLPGHARWASFLRALRYVVIDECHVYRGVFGSHVADVLRRLWRVCARYHSVPTMVLASATMADPAQAASRLTGRPVVAVTDDASPRGPATLVLWEPPVTGVGDGGAPTRRSAVAEAADLLTDLVAGGTRTLAFTRSRRGAETVAATARRLLGDVDPELAGRVAAYRGGYLPDERRILESALRDGDLLGLSATNALELGIDVHGLDAVLMAGWPGTRASLWQQAGRAGRHGTEALAVFVARDDPLDSYLVHHPQALLDAPVETSVTAPDNPYVLAPHLAAAAAELPLTEEDLPAFGPAARELVDLLVERGWLRARPGGWYWTREQRASDLADLRGIGGTPVRVVEAGTGRLLGTVDAGAAHTSVHSGAVYVHQGETYIVDHLDLDDAVAHVHAEVVSHTTYAREVSELTVVAEDRRRRWGAATLAYGSVRVRRRVVAYQRRHAVTGEVLATVALDLPERELTTRAVWWSLHPETVADVLDDADVAGAVHAAEHASIGLLPLVAGCDRWDLGGVSSARHPDTDAVTSFVYDGLAGGAGFAERGFEVALGWLGATRDTIRDCPCRDGCPSCVQSPKCGNGNSPLDKAGAYLLLDRLLREAPLSR